MGKKEAAQKAGFDHAGRDAYPLLATPEGTRYIRDRVQRLIQTEDAPEARKIALELLRSIDTPRTVRWSIAQTLLAYGAGVVTPKAGEPLGSDKTPAEMTSDELRVFIAEIEGELGKRAIAIAAPAPDDTQAIENLM